MTSDEAKAISRRLEKHDEKLDRIISAVTAQVATCKVVRGTVASHERALQGNGQSGLIRDVARLKEAKIIRGKGFWAMVTFVASLVSGIMVAAAKALPRWW